MPVFVVLLPAFGLALWAGLRMAPGQLYGLPVTPLATVALLVLVAGVVYLGASLQAAPQESALEETFPAQARRSPAGSFYPLFCCLCYSGVMPVPCCTTGRSYAAWTITPTL